MFNNFAEAKIERPLTTPTHFVGRGFCSSCLGRLVVLIGVFHLASADTVSSRAFLELSRDHRQRHQG